MTDHNVADIMIERANTNKLANNIIYKCSL